MNIGFDAKRLFFNASGLGNYGRGLIRALCHTFPEHQYHLFTPENGPIDYTPPQSAAVCYPDSIAGRISQAWWRSFGLSGQVKRHNLDIFHGMNNELPAGIEKIGCRTVMTVHDLILKRYPAYFSAIDRYIYEKKSRRSAAVADCIVADSLQTKRDLIEFYSVPEQKIRVVYPGCDPAFFTTPSPEEVVNVKARYNLPRQYILSVGTIETRKNMVLAVKALGTAKINIPLVMVGRSTPYEATVRETARSLGIADAVRIFTTMPTRDLPALYAGAELFVYPSRFEGFGIPVLEALCCGTPVIAATGSCLEEPGGPGTIYVNPDDVQGMSLAIERVLNDIDLRRQMAATGLLHAQNFTDEKIARSQMAVYLDVRK
jgi:glycosyltransferase involved in cell wall biosynthesis